ncbi:hypothetical protein [Thermosporothrix hazakensis]|uniref:hypothetical protein n=1 Tax=Thermosporothrix hazakensis TaxID=644383 RepID=UPI001B86D19A|nr:hypothetical protein [Thermosporothrix hazakensis]
MKKDQKRKQYPSGVTINQCPNCRIWKDSEGFRWACDDYHPEVLAYTSRSVNNGNARGLGAIRRAWTIE